MPARKPIGAVTRPATRTMASVRRIGCQPAPQRMSTTIPKPIAPNSGVIQSARRRPARVSRRQPPPAAGGACWTSWVAAVVVTFWSSLLRLLARLDQEPHQGVQLRLRERLAEVRRHEVLGIPRLDVRIRVDDRLVDERGERLVRLLC